MLRRFLRFLIGAPRDVTDRSVYHKISLAAVLAWVGLGADGLSSSAYGPEEAFRALGEHTYLAVALVIATAITVMVISIGYSRIIEHFPFGGGGYIVASQLLHPNVGVLSGSALLVDYTLTVSVSIAASAHHIFSVLPASLAPYKVYFAALVIMILVILNLRGVKESITILTPIFVTFCITHLILILGGIVTHLGEVPHVASEVSSGFGQGMKTLGLGGLFVMFFRAYSMGGGTYTGIEAVANGLQIMREPKVETGKRTMLYMSVSLAFTAGGVLLCYLLFNVGHVENKSMNYTLLQSFAGHWHIGNWALGKWFVVLTLASEAALLFVAAQTGFIDGPRVMANMAIDSWLPRRFAQLSDRLTMQNGVLMMGIASIAILFYTGGDVTALVTMYAINVFLDFSISQFAMCKYSIQRRREQTDWRRGLAIHLTAFLLCFSILTVVVIEKFAHGAWLTLVITGVLITFCFLIRRHYHNVQRNIRAIDQILEALPNDREAVPIPIDRSKPTAVMLVSSYSGLGVHQLLSVQRLFPNFYKNYVFLSAGVVDSATMKGIEEVDRIHQNTQTMLDKYVQLANKLGFAAEARMAMGTEAIETAEELCLQVVRDYPRSTFFAGKLLFQEEKWYHRFLHNETAYQLQRRLHFDGMNAIVLPVRVFSQGDRPPTQAPAKTP